VQVVGRKVSAIQ